MRGLSQDFRFGIRMLIRNRSFACVANSAVFGVIYGVLLNPLPYRDSARLVRVYENNSVEGFRLFPLSPADFLDYHQQNRVFQDIATYMRQDQQYGGERPERLIGLRVSHEYFRVFGADPVLGRAFNQDEEAAGGATDVAIVSHKLWKRLFAGDPHVIGKIIKLTDYPFRIVGVMPAGFEHRGRARSHGSATNPLTLAAMAAILAAVAMAACFAPARRALSIDPIEALRHE